MATVDRAQKTRQVILHTQTKIKRISTQMNLKCMGHSSRNSLTVITNQMENVSYYLKYHLLLE